MKVFLACDHAGIDLKNELAAYLAEKEGFEPVDIGIGTGEKIDYPVAAEDLCGKVLKENALGILICGTGIGMSMAANKVNAHRLHQSLRLDQMDQRTHPDRRCQGRPHPFLYPAALL